MKFKETSVIKEILDYPKLEKLIGADLLDNMELSHETLKKIYDTYKIFVSIDVCGIYTENGKAFDTTLTIDKNGYFTGYGDDSGIKHIPPGGEYENKQTSAIFEIRRNECEDIDCYKIAIENDEYENPELGPINLNEYIENLK